MTDLIKPWNSEYDGYLRDESRRIGNAVSISFPESETDVVAVVNAARAASRSLTVQGARTGIVAGAVPEGGHVMNLSRLKGIGEVRRDAVSGQYTLALRPGTLLTEIRDALAESNLFFPPDPTETSASVGGMVACNASGAMSFFYGPTRDWIVGLRVVLSGGDLLALRRGDCRAEGRRFVLRTEANRVIAGRLPEYRMPGVKNAAGYYAADDMDMLDLFVGMEGTLGVITEIVVRLAPRPAAMCGIVAFLPTEAAALKYVRAMRGETVPVGATTPLRPVAIELFNRDALNLLRRMKTEHEAFAKIPELKPEYHTAIYTEYHGDSEDALDTAVMAANEVLLEQGGSDADTWIGMNPRELEPLKAFRHAIPEAVNLLIDERKKTCPGLTKLGTDMSVPDAELENALAVYRDGLRAENLESVIFGHIGNNHVHVNILPRSMEEYERGKALYQSWARRAVAVGGSVSAEHGIGKLKPPMLKLMYGEEGVAQMRELKQLLDPDMILNPGNLF